MSTELTVVPRGPVSTLEGYLSMVQAQPWLEADEEHRLAVAYRDRHDRAAAERLVLSHLRLVVSVARRYLGYGLPFADLIQEGTVGLMRAVKRFDPDRGVRLAPFAVYHIRRDVQEFILRNWRLVRVATTRTQRKLFFNLRRSRRGLGWMGATEEREVAALLGVRREQVREMLTRMLGTDVSVDAQTEGSGEHDPMPLLELRDPSPDPAAALSAQEHEALVGTALAAAVASLDERSRDIVTSRWLNERRTTLEQLGTRYRISKERVRQIEAKALETLRTHLADAA